MAPSINRTAIFLNLAAFSAFVALCELTQAPMIQEDILRRCQDAFVTHGISIQGLTVEGRDVILKGTPQSEIVSSRTYSLAAGLSGVRDVRTEVVNQTQATAEERVPASAASSRQREIQARIDRLLGDRQIDFKPDSAVLTPAAEQLLNEVSRYLLEAPSLRCEIWVYASQLPGARQGVTWAMLRALSTEDFLIGKGIAEWRLSTYALTADPQSQSPAAQSPNSQGPNLPSEELSKVQGQSAVPAAPASSLSVAEQRRRPERAVDLVVKAR